MSQAAPRIIAVYSRTAMRAVVLSLFGETAADKVWNRRSDARLGKIVANDGCSEKAMLGARNPGFINLSEHP
jgi:hypothetical protein